MLENAAAPQDRMIVSGQVLFDAFGRTVSQRYPIVEPKTSENVNRAFNPGFDTTVAPTTMTYDVLDRNTRTTIPDGTFTTIAYGFGPDRSSAQQFETVVTDANKNAGLPGAVTRTYRDVRELITAVKELNKAGTETIWTSYSYDALKQIVQVLDDKNNTTNVAYDNFGRRAVINNPDTGRTETRYDLAGNVTKKIPANLQAQAKSIDYNYDFNRLISIGQPNFLGNAVTYAYGTAAAAGDLNGNAAGRLTKITSQMGVEERKYGRLGETVYEKKTVNTFTGPTPRFYETRFLFETFGRLLRITYPDGEVVTNEYDSGGNLTSATGVKAVSATGQNHRYHYLQKLHYDKFEQRAFMEQGNGVKTAYTYDPQNRRLSNLNAVRQGNTIFQNLSYSYDKVGNILGLKNDVALPQANDYGGPSLQRFQYDDLYRLTKAQGVFPANPNAALADKSACNGVPTSHCRVYSVDMSYDSIHNIQTKNQRDTRYPPGNTQGIVQKKTDYDFTYQYAASGPASVRPHAPTHIGDRTYAYDANGNQTGWTHDQNGTRRTIVWDDENRIQSIADNGSTKDYKYDDTGDRVIKRGPQGETVYVNQFFTDRPGATGTKHVYAGKTRIASKMLRQDTQGANPNGNTPFEKDIYFYHPDHLGSSSYITDLNGKLYEHLVYLPFGEGWIEENTNVQRTPYHFTAKELDEETGLYYFGARYYDPRTSVWQSADPIVPNYFPFGNKDHESDLAGMGGVFNSHNLGLYSYAHLNPLRFTDPDGNEAEEGNDGKAGKEQSLWERYRAWSDRDRKLKEQSPEAVLDALFAIRGGRSPRGSTKSSATKAPAVPAAERGSVQKANFAQNNKVLSTKEFSKEGQDIYSKLAGKPIRTVEDLTKALKDGVIKPNQIPVGYVDMNGTRLILNTRTSAALEGAGIPRSEWYGQNLTGVQVPGAPKGYTFNDAAAQQLKNNKLPPTGAPERKQ